MKKIVILLSAMALFAGVSCQKAESPVEQVKGRPVTLTVGLGAETRVSHGLEGTTIKPAWENTDYVFVKGDASAIWEKFSIDAVTISSDGKSASFVNESSVLDEDESYTVIYATEAFLSNSNDPTSFNISAGQDGTLAKLPEYLVAENVTLGDLAGLESKLTYFHIIFTKAAGSNVSLGSLQPISLARKTSTPMGTSYSGEFYVTPNATSKTKISLDPPSASIATWENGTIAKIDFHVAVFMPENNAGTTYHLNFDAPGLGFGHGGSTDGNAGLGSYSWISTKQYTSGKVYKKEFAY